MNAGPAPTTAAYGEWLSPVGVDLLTEGSGGLAEPLFDGPDLLWLESRPDQAGRVSLWRRRAGSSPVELTPECNVRTRVHEYGGGAYHSAGGVVVHSSFPDDAVHLISPDGGSRALQTPQAQRFAAFEVHPERDLAVAVAEDHGGSGEATASLVALLLGAAEGGSPDPTDGASCVLELVSGASFYDSPTLSDDGWLAWCEWDHPNMPWDSTRIKIARLVEDGSAAGGPASGAGASEPEPDAGAHRIRVSEVRTMVDDGFSNIHPTWSPDGRLIFLSDRTGFWNLYAWNPTSPGDENAPRCLHEQPDDFGTPPWQLGRGDFAILSQDRILCRWLHDGVAQLGLLTGDGLRPVPTSANSLNHLTGHRDRLACTAGFADRPPTLLEVDLAGIEQGGTATESIVRSSAEPELDPGCISVARGIDFGDPLTHAWFYPPTNQGFQAPEGELPPLCVLSHGGPTGFATPALSLAIQFWTSRGFAVVDVNYGGSAGYGRAYRERLKGRWGIVDVADCVAAAQHLVDHGLVDPRRIWIEGGSAGGYTTLRALTDTDFFAAGISHFGVGDLAALARDTHKFESRYLDGLVGPWPQAEQVYAERSPVHHLDRLATPMLILQGDQDKVVPPAQAEEMADAVRAKGLPVALVMFAGEGHGFRRADSIRRTLEASQSFLGQVFGFTPADELEPLKIENL